MSESGSGGAAGGGGGASGESDAIRDQDRLLPIANISRIMKRVLPDHAKMSKESKSSIQECVSEFIGFITSEASDRLSEDKRKTITGDDIIEAMKALGFDNYVEFLLVYLRKYRQSSKARGGMVGAGEIGAAGRGMVGVRSSGGGGGSAGDGKGRGRKRDRGDDDDSDEDDEDDEDDDDDDDDRGGKRRRSG